MIPPQKRKNAAASARDRLLALARKRGEDFQLLLTRYGLERLLYRLSKSPYRDRFVLKGAMLFVLWSDTPHRPTRDIDFLGSGDCSDTGLTELFRVICAMPDQDDGVTFDPESVRVESIRDDAEYGGMRVMFTGQLAGARIPVQADIGFGDVVTPHALEMDYPTLLGGLVPRLRVYPRETVIAEKYQALVTLGIANSRMKDFYDLWVMARDFDFEGEPLATAIRNTFERRRTKLPTGTPSGLSPGFADDRQKNTQWQAFLSKLSAGQSGPKLTEVCEFLDTFLRPPSEAARLSLRFDAIWHNGGPWSSDATPRISGET